MTPDALAWITHQRPRMEALLRELVLMSSHTRDKAGCDAVAEALIATMPLACTRVASRAYGDHLVFHNARPASDGGVILVGHHDTVFPRGTFEGYRVDGELARGPGVVDMKGGLVVIAFALRALREVGELDAIPLSLAIVSDEEVGSPESAAHVREVARGATAALVFESGRAGDAIITRRKGTGAVTARARGRAAHAGNAHRDGANAIRALARFIEAAESLTDHDRGVTVNVGLVEGGTSKNTVPERARAELDFRFVRREDGEAIVVRLGEVARAHGVEGVTVDLEGGIAREPLERTPASEALYRAYARHQREEGLGDGESALLGGGSDASTTAAVGVPSIDGLGPRGYGFHTTDERVELATLAPKARSLVRFLRASRAGGDG